MKKLILSALTTASFSFADVVPAVDIDVSLGYVFQGISGKASYQGGEVDLKDQLKLGSSNNIMAKIKFEHPVPILPNLYFQYTPATFKGTTNLQSLGWGGQNFSGNIESSFTVNRTDIGIYWNLPVPVVDIELGLMGRIFDFKGSVTGTVGAVRQTETASFKYPIPMIYLSAGGYFPGLPVGLFGDFKIITFGGATYSDLMAELRGKFMFLYGALGYKYENLSIKIESENVDSNVTISGLYLKAGVLF